MKIKHKYVIDDIQWENEDSGLPTCVELPYNDWELSKRDDNYRTFFNLTEKAYDYYCDDLFSAGYEYIQDVYSGEHESMIIYRDFDVELEESDIIDYIKNLSEKEFNELKKKIDELEYDNVINKELL